MTLGMRQCICNGLETGLVGLMEDLAEIRMRRRWGPSLERYRCMVSRLRTRCDSLERENEQLKDHLSMALRRAESAEKALSKIYLKKN